VRNRRFHPHLRHFPHRFFTGYVRYHRCLRLAHPRKVAAFARTRGRPLFLAIPAFWRTRLPGFSKKPGFWTRFRTAS